MGTTTWEQTWRFSLSSLGCAQILLQKSWTIASCCDPFPPVRLKGAQPFRPVLFPLWDECQSQVCYVHFLSRVFKAQAIPSIACPAWYSGCLSCPHSLLHPGRGEQQVKSGEHSNRGESNSLWILLATPRKASFSSLKFQEMFHCLHCGMGLFQIGMWVEMGTLGGWGNFPLLLRCRGLAAGGRGSRALISPSPLWCIPYADFLWRQRSQVH